MTSIGINDPESWIVCPLLSKKRRYFSRSSRTVIGSFWQIVKGAGEAEEEKEGEEAFLSSISVQIWRLCNERNLVWDFFQKCSTRIKKGEGEEQGRKIR